MVTDILVKTGFKRTDVGIIPQDWNVKELQEITDMVTNGFVGKAKDHYTEDNDGVTYIQGFNVKENSFDLTGIKKVTSSFHAKHQKSSLREGDLLTIQTGDVGLTTIVPPQLVGSNCHALIISRFKKNVANPLFYSFYFNSPLGRNRLKDLETGSTMKHLNVGDMLVWQVPFPTDLSEQQRIATILEDINNLVTKVDQLIEKKRNIKQGTMQELLTGKRRLPGFSGEWETRNIEQTADCLDTLRIPLNDKQRSQMKGDIPYCGANGVVDYVNDYVVDDDIILIAEDGGYFDEYAYRPIAYRMKGKCWVNNHAHILKAKDNTDQGYLFYSLVHKNILSFLSSGTRAKLNKSEMYKIEMFMPTEKEEQNAISEILVDMDNELSNLESKKEKYLDIKQGMMQQLLTGRIRLV